MLTADGSSTSTQGNAKSSGRSSSRNRQPPVTCSIGSCAFGALDVTRPPDVRPHGGVSGDIPGLCGMPAVKVSRLGCEEGFGGGVDRIAPVPAERDGASLALRASAASRSIVNWNQGALTPEATVLAASGKGGAR